MLRILAATLMVIGLGAATSSAHHSYAAFDREHPVSIEGNLAQVLYSNPHVVMTVRTADGDYTVEWLSFTQVSRWMIEKGTLHVGDHVVITARATRDRTEHRLSLVTDIRRPADGWSWSRPLLQAVPQNAQP
jgi:hypothetical protein